MSNNKAFSTPQGFSTPEMTTLGLAGQVRNDVYGQANKQNQALQDIMNQAINNYGFDYTDSNTSMPDKNTKSYEGFKGDVYTDTTGNSTVGYGHKLTPEEIQSGIYKNGISKEQASLLYESDMANHRNKFYRNNPWASELPQNARHAMEDMSFNMGSGFLEKFPIARGHLQSGAYGKAADEFMNSLYAKQVGQRALDNVMRIRGN